MILLDNAGALDELSTGVLLNLLQTRTARLIATAQRTTDLPPDFYWLITSGQLAEVRLANLTELETLEVLQSALGHRVSTALASQLHQLVGGSPTLLQAVVSEQIERGNLVLSGSVWTLLDEVVLDGRTALEDIVRARYARETPEAREVIDVLSCARTLPLSRLARMYSPGVIADMEEAGQIVVDRADRHLVTLGRPLPRRHRPQLAQRGAPAGAPGQGPRTPEHELDELTVEDLLAYAAWTHDCGAQLAPAHAAGRGQRRRQTLRPQVRPEMRQQPDAGGPGVGRRTVTEIGGLPAAGPSPAGDVGAGRCLGAQIGALPAEALPNLWRRKPTAWRGWTDRSGKVPGLIEQARARLTELSMDDPAPAADELSRASRCLDLCEFNYLSFIGDYQPMMERLHAPPAAATPAASTPSIPSTGSGPRSS